MRPGWAILEENSRLQRVFIERLTFTGSQLCFAERLPERKILV